MKYVILIFDILAAGVTATTGFPGHGHSSIRARDADTGPNLFIRSFYEPSTLLQRRGLVRAQTVRDEGRGVGRSRTQPQSPGSSVKSEAAGSSRHSTPSRNIPDSQRAQPPSSRQSLHDFYMLNSPASSSRIASPVRSTRSEKGSSIAVSTDSSLHEGPPSPWSSQKAREAESERSSLSSSPEGGKSSTPRDFRSPGSASVKWSRPGESESPPPRPRSRRGSPHSTPNSTPERYRSPPLQDATPESAVIGFTADTSDSGGLSGASTIGPRPAKPVSRKLQFSG